MCTRCSNSMSTICEVCGSTTSVTRAHLQYTHCYSRRAPAARVLLRVGDVRETLLIGGGTLLLLLQASPSPRGRTFCRLVGTRAVAHADTMPFMAMPADAHAREAALMHAARLLPSA